MLYHQIRLEFHWYYNNGYITQRDGNYCEKFDENKFIVTASGVDKSVLGESDFVEVSSLGIRQGDYVKKPSIETLGHIAALQRTNKQASVHVHSPNTVALFEIAQRNNKIPALIKVFNKDWPEFFRYTKLGALVKYNTPGSIELHQDISQAFSQPNVDIVVMQKHGVLAVGEDFKQCRGHIQRLEHLSSILLKIASASNLAAVVNE